VIKEKLQRRSMALSSKFRKAVERLVVQANKEKEVLIERSKKLEKQ